MIERKIINFIKLKFRKKRTIFLLIFAFLFCAMPVLFVQAQEVQEDLFHVSGIIEGTGRNFKITGSEYLNITLDSSEEITARIESAPEMIVIDIQASSEFSSADITISGLSPNTTYHKYQDDYHNYAPLISDENGKAFFVQNISQNHLIFIQPRKSTKFINTDPRVNNCGLIGIWNASSKTCTLNKDVNETIQIDSDGITLDGNGHKVTGTNTGYGVAVRGGQYIVKNIIVSGFTYGIYVRKNGSVISNTVARNYYGIYANGANPGVIISNNSVSANIHYGISFFNTKNNIVSNNIVGPGNRVGLFQSSSSYDTYENNDYFSNQSGIVLNGNYNILRGNIMHGNSESNFYIKSSDMATNDIGIDNTIDSKPIYYEKNVSNKTYDDSMNIGAFYCANCENIILKNVSLTDKQAQMVFWHTNNSLVEGLTSEDKSIAVALDYSTNNTIRKNTFSWIKIAYGGGNSIYNNNIMSLGMMTSIYPSFGSSFYQPLPTGGNYWKNNETKCKDLDNNKICDTQFLFDGGTDLYPWAQESGFSTPTCCSSVMFLPGHQASRLYKEDPYGEMQLWEPEVKNEDVKKLFLNSEGESVDSGIYTRDIVDEAYGIKNIYKNFIASMNQFVADGVVNEWKSIPYDWRLPLEKIAEDGVELEDGGHMDIIQEIERMAAASRTGKVTLIGHSNGGLLAKALIDHLKDSGGNEKLVDKLIMVGTPQLGTPKAIAGLLHGDEINLLRGLILDKKTARDFAENMVSAYNLLPSKKYFDIVQSPVIEFNSDVKEIYDFRSLYGENIDNWDEFKKFLLGDDGARTEPEASDLDSPNVLKEALLANASATHDNLDSWQAPEGMEVVQIAGWGLDTIRGIEYDDCDFIFCPDKLSNLDRSLIFTEDGDETVVVPSAVEMGGDAERYYLNVKEYNDNERIIINAKHAFIMEVEQLQDFIKNIIQNSKTLTDYISTEKPEVKDEDRRLRFQLHSPVSMDLYDENGNHTGLIQNTNPLSDLQFYEEQIPNSYYTEFGETKYAGTGDSLTNIILTGEDLGTFTFEIDQVAGDQITKNTTFANIPVMKDMQATLSVSETVSEMKIDVDGNGQIDATFRP